MGEQFENQQDAIQEKFDRLTGKDKFEIVLGLFGSESSRKAFLEVCARYASLRSVSLPDLHAAESYEYRRVYSPPKRANLHNQIMETLQRLSLRRLTHLQEKVMNQMAERETAGKFIKEYILAHEGGDEDEESDPKERKPDDMSGPSYYHSLGRGN